MAKTAKRAKNRLTSKQATQHLVDPVQ